MNKDMYSLVLEDAASKMKEQIISEFNREDFKWDALVSLILEEDSPLQLFFSKKTLQFAALYGAASQLHNSASKIEERSNTDVG